MATQGSTGHAPRDPPMDVVDASPAFGFHHRLDDNSPLEEAMGVRSNYIVGIDNPAYKMNHPKRGIALIINNEVFHADTGMKTRNGSTSDAISMKAAFSKLGFDVIVRTNMVVKKMKQIFEDISLDDHSNNDCFVCVILSHGDDNGVIYGVDKTISLDDLISYILPDKCPSLAGKPKLVFVQACRGTKPDNGVGVEVHDAIEVNPSYKKIPIWADMLIAYSSVAGYYSWRNSSKGSWFIQSLSNVLEQYGTELEILQIMTKVNFQVAYEFESKSDNPVMSGLKQVPCLTSMLTKELIFHPKA